MSKLKLGRPRIGKYQRQMLTATVDVSTMATLNEHTASRRSRGETIDNIVEFAIKKGFK